MSYSKNKPIVLILGATPYEERNYLILNKMGIDMIMTDQSRTAPMLKYATEHWHISADDSKGIMALFEKSKQRDDIILAYSGNDFGTATSTEINKKIFGCDALAVPPEETNNKNVMKALFKNRDIQIPESFTIQFSKQSCEEMFEMILEKIGLPCICKPDNMSGAFGVKYISNENDFISYHREFKEQFHTCIVEEYIEGEHLDLNGYVVNGVFYGSGSADRFFITSDHRISHKCYAPSNLKKEQLKSAISALERASNAFQLSYSPIKCDVIIGKDKKPYMLETALRFHGGLTSSGVMPLGGGVYSFFEYLLKIYPDFADRYFNSFSVNSSVGMVHIIPELSKGIVPLYELPGSLPGIYSIFIRKRPPVETSLYLKSNHDIVGYIISYGYSREECDVNVANALLNIKRN